MNHVFADRFRNRDQSKINQSERNLWCEVLFVLWNDAIFGAPSILGNKQHRINETIRARNFFNAPSRDLRVICELIGVDSEAVRERILPIIAIAPSPEELVSGRRMANACRPMAKPRRDRRNPQRPGVPLDLRGNSGTGAGSDAQDSFKIDFSR